MNRQQFEKILFKSIRNDRLRRLANKLVKSWLTDDDRKMLREKHGAGEDSPGKTGVPKSDHPLETIGRESGPTLTSAHKRVLGKMLSDHSDATGDDARAYHTNKIKSYLDGMGKDVVKHNKDWFDEKVAPHQHDIKELVGRTTAPYRDLKEYHDKHGSDATKQLINSTAHHGPYIGKTDHHIHDKGIYESQDNLFEDAMNYSGLDHPQKDDIASRFRQSEKDYNNHGYASKIFDSETDPTDEEEDAAQNQYDKFKKLQTDDMWQGFKHKHGIK